MAGRSPLERLCDRCRASVDHVPLRKIPLGCTFEDLLRASERDRTQEVAVGIIGKMIGVACNPDHVFNPAVIGFDIFVRDRPVFSHAVVTRRLEVPRAEPQRDKSPMQRFATHRPRADPGKLFAGVGVFNFVDKVLLVPLVGRVVVHRALRGPNLAAKGKLVRLPVGMKIGGDIEPRSGFQHQDLESF